MPYPRWAYSSPDGSTPNPWLVLPAWVEPFVAAVVAVERELSAAQDQPAVLAALTPGLSALDYRIEISRRRHHRIRLSAAGLPMEPDGWHAEHRVVVEVETESSVRGNAVYRDLVRASLSEANYLALLMPYEDHRWTGRQNARTYCFDDAKNLIDTAYGKRSRLQLSLSGVLLVAFRGG